MQNKPTTVSGFVKLHAFFQRIWFLSVYVLPGVFAFFPSFTSQVLAGDDKAAFFEKEIRPVLVESCYECHSATSKKLKAGLRLDTKAAVLAGGDSGPAIVAGKPEESTLYLALKYEGDAVEMPPKGKLTPSVIENFRQWIADGAFDPRTAEPATTATADASWESTFRKRLDWWSFRPLARVEPPKSAEANPIDAFLTAKLTEKGLSFAPEAGRETLLRRLSFDLTGLPPTEAEIQAFLADKSARAYENQVDRLLASPHYGERMARRWMDLTHYSETVGSEQDALIPYAWAYRDYLIRAFNQDLPFDSLLKEHLAGDLLEQPRRDPATGLAESPIGTSWSRFVEFYHSPVDVKNEEIVVVDNQIDTLGKTFLGLTIACARCHDHKFDPIGTDDFYSLYAALRTARATVHTLADPEKVRPVMAHAAAEREKVRQAIARMWQQELPTLKARLSVALTADQPIAPELAGFFKASAASPLKWGYPLALARQALDMKQDVTSAYRAAAKTVQEQGLATWRTPNSKQRLLADFSDPNKLPDGWSVIDGQIAGPIAAGSFRLGHKPEQVVEFLRPSGFYTDAITEKQAVTLRSPEFTLSDGTYSVLVSGTSSARLRLVVDNFQGVDILFGGVTPVLNSAQLVWMKLPVREIWRGRQAYLELVTRDNMPSAGVIRDLNQLPKDGRSTFGIKYVVHHANNESAHEDSAALASLLKAGENQNGPTPAELVQHVEEQAGEAINAFLARTLTDSQAALLQDLIDAKLLSNQAVPGSELTQAIGAFRAVEESIDLSAKTNGMTDDCTSDVHQTIFLRGDHHKTGRATPPADLKLNAVLNASPSTGQALGQKSPRLALAEAWSAPEQPLVNRVIVNRVWHWYFGRGIFATVDNVGHLGEPPSHPELLDWLARDFVGQGSSIKNLTRRIVLSRAYRQSSQATDRAFQIDPNNILLSHASVRRLDAESLRDALLTASGRLDRTLYGLPLPTPQPPGLTDDKKPVSGPVDGNGRRSIYLNVRKNFPVEFLEVFDRPRPTVTVGNRNTSNQPAQALAMLNDPFVKGEANRLGQLLAENRTDDETARLNSLYLRLFGRKPDQTEISRCHEWLKSGGTWPQLVEALFGTKEFIFLK